jgi:hypothetical protein
LKTIKETSINRTARNNRYASGMVCANPRDKAKPELVYPETMRSSRREHQRAATHDEVHPDIGTLVSL